MKKLQGILIAAFVLSFLVAPALMAAEILTEANATSGKTGYWKCGYMTAFQHNYNKTYSYGYLSGTGWLKAYDNVTEEQLLSTASGDKKACIYKVSSSSWSAMRSY